MAHTLPIYFLMHALSNHRVLVYV